MERAANDATHTNLELRVQQNAYDFLEESLRYADQAVSDPVGWKFAVILAAQSIELLLKARLEMEHPLLVFTDPDKGRSGPTVNVQSAIKRLAACGVVLPEDEIDRLLRAQRLRNQFMHLEVKASVEQVEEAYVDLFEFAHAFHDGHLPGELHDHLSEDLYPSEAAMIDRFRREYVRYQGTTVQRCYPSEIIDAQFAPRVRIGLQLLDRIRHGAAEGWMAGTDRSCDDCAVLPGQLHVAGCDLERCPGCGGQMLGCDCEVEWDEVDEIDSFRRPL